MHGFRNHSCKQLSLLSLSSVPMKHSYCHCCIAAQVSSNQWRYFLNFLFSVCMASPKMQCIGLSLPLEVALAATSIQHNQTSNQTAYGGVVYLWFCYITFNQCKNGGRDFNSISSTVKCQKSLRNLTQVRLNTASHQADTRQRPFWWQRMQYQGGGLIPGKLGWISYGVANDSCETYVVVAVQQQVDPTKCHLPSRDSIHQHGNIPCSQSGLSLSWRQCLVSVLKISTVQEDMRENSQVFSPKNNSA